MQVLERSTETAADANVTHLERVVIFNVKLRMTAKGITQQELGEALGIKKSTISSKLSGHTAWSLADLVRAAAFLGTTPETLMDDSIMNAMGVTAPVRAQAAASPAEKKNAGDNAGEECPGCENNIQTD